MSFITIGTFDGFHLGHRYLLKQLNTEAKRADKKSLVIYFDFPPKLVIKKNLKRNVISLPDEKKKLILGSAPDGIKKIAFDRRFARISCKKFFDEILIKKYNIKGLVVGRDFAFGCHRHGHIDFLREQCAKNHIPLVVVSFLCAYGHKISSSVVRQAILAGDIEKANNLLGRHFSVTGNVKKDTGLGRKLGFPTANIDINPYKIIPFGVFGVKVHLGGDIYSGVLNVGFRPTIRKHQKKPSVEVHILGLDRNIYRQKITLEFLWKIRREKKFKNIFELKTQIAKDAKLAKKIFDTKRFP